MADSFLDIKEILEDYSEDIKEKISDSAIQIAKEGKEKLVNTKNTYKIRSGDYNKSWSVKSQKGKDFVKATIYNKKHYRLTHLLECGHATRNGKRTREFTHIAPVESYVTKKYQKECENIIRKG